MMFMSLFDDSTFCHHTDLHRNPSSIHHSQRIKLMNYTLKQLQERVNKLIEQQGEDANIAAWIYTKEDIHMKDENGEFDYDNEVDIAPELVERIFDDVGNIDYIYQVIQECVDEVTEENLMETK